jgi:hypothetical protein
MRQYIGAVIIERNIFDTLYLMSKKSPINFVGNRNKIFTGERHVSNENNH